MSDNILFWFIFGSFGISMVIGLIGLAINKSGIIQKMKNFNNTPENKEKSQS